MRINLPRTILRIAFLLTLACALSLMAATRYPVPQLRGLPPLEIPEDNPLTYEGIDLGHRLFFDPILSGDNTQSCASCHVNQKSFSDSKQFSIGIDGSSTPRNAMAIINLAWDTSFFWDGRQPSLEKQAIEPVENPSEMNEEWPHAISELKSHPDYPALFYQAFGTTTITRDHVTKAISQFERILISANSKFDQYKREEISLTSSELRGLEIFTSERGDCFHCHVPAGRLFADNRFHNNGLDSNPKDTGRYQVTGDPEDIGKFKTPTLRNIALTAPYMHDGRFDTLEEVIDHYDQGGMPSPTIDPLMKYVGEGLNLTPQDKLDLIAFLHTLTDLEFVNNPMFSDPNTMNEKIKTGVNERYPEIIKTP